MVTQQPNQEWVLLSYRVPREPSTPRITIWRKLRQLGVVQLGDGLVALPSDARTKEHFQWVAERVRESNGDAIVWTAVPDTRRQSAELASRMRDERNVEYEELLVEVDEASDPTPRTVQRWRREWRRIDRRDYFRAPLRDRARIAISDAAEVAGMAKETSR